MNTTTAIEPGTKVRHKLSGIAGYVSSRTQYLAGYTFLSVQPIAKKGATEEPKRVWSDECEWEPLGESVERGPASEVRANFFDLGSRVRDIVSGFQGIVNARTESINRCWGYGVQSEVVNKKDGASGAVEHFSSQRLQLVDDGIVKRMVKPRKTGAAPHEARKGL